MITCFASGLHLCEWVNEVWWCRRVRLRSHSILYMFYMYQGERWWLYVHEILSAFIAGWSWILRTRKNIRVIFDCVINPQRDLAPTLLFVICTFLVHREKFDPGWCSQDCDVLVLPELLVDVLHTLLFTISIGFGLYYA